MQLSISYTRIIWKIGRRKVEARTDFIFLGSKVTADGDCSHEIKKHLLLENYDKPSQCIKKQRHHFISIVMSKLWFLQ